MTPIDWIRHHCKMNAHAAAGPVAAGEQVGRLRPQWGARRGGDRVRQLSRCWRASPGSCTKPLGGVDPDTATPSDPLADPANPGASAASAGPLKFDEVRSWSWPASIRLVVQ